MSDTSQTVNPGESSPKKPAISRPLYAQWPSSNIVQGAGVAIFHLRTLRVVVCYHSRDKYWFLPKGRKDQLETIEQAAVREGFEESGYRNRLLPLPLPTRQTPPREFIPYYKRNVTEAVWIQLLPLDLRHKQYLLHWFIAETVTIEIDKQVSDAEREEQKRLDNLSSEDLRGGRYKTPHPYPYHRPPPYPKDLTIKDRIALEKDHEDYEPVKHTDTSADAEEELYQSFLLDVEEAQKKLGNSVEADVVKIGWEAIQERMKIESAAEKDGTSDLLFFDPHDNQ